MKTPARLALAVVVLMAAFIALPRPASRYVSPDASAQVPTPLISDILGSPKPSNSPSEDPDPIPEPDPEPTSGSGGGGNNNEGGGGGDDDPKNGGGDGRGDNVKKGDDGRRPGETAKEARQRKKKKKNKPQIVGPPSSIGSRIPGAYDTSKLVAAATQLRSLGMSQDEVVRKVYPPFIHAGESQWIDTWGAPRYGPAPGQIRTHEGQDVFCDYGDPVLAPEAGTLNNSDGGLGGVTVRVVRPDGKYWYMAHLDAFNEEFSTGDSVEAGDVVGYCGNSGNAITTPTHTHFGFYDASGSKTSNPMKYLVRWLRQAESRLSGVVAETDKKRQKEYESGAITAARRFGDAFAPDRSELSIAGESLWASGSSPASGAFGLAEAALQEALSTNGLELGIVPVPVDLQLPQSQGQPELQNDSALAQLLKDSTASNSYSEGSD